MFLSNIWPVSEVLANRAALVELLYTEPVPAGVVVVGRTA